MSDLPHADPKLRPLFYAALRQCRDFLAAANDFRDSLLSIGPVTPPEPCWNQDWSPRLDALAAYVTVRRVRPARIVEIGAGHSTRFLARAVRSGGLKTGITSLDPEPRDAKRAIGGRAYLHTDTIGGLLRRLRTGGGRYPFRRFQSQVASQQRCRLPLQRFLPLLVRGYRVHFHHFSALCISCPSDISTARRTSCRRRIGGGERLADRIRVRACGSPFGG